MCGMQANLVRAATLCALVGAAIAVTLTSHGLALSLAPVFLLVGWLAVGRFPGEKIIERLRSPRCRRRPPGRPANARPACAPSFVRRVGLTVAFALAVRPPPVSLPLI
jgi:hypothetical protein